METNNGLLRFDLLGDSNFERLPFHKESIFLQLPWQRIQAAGRRPSEYLTRNGINTSVTGADKFILAGMPSVMASEVRTDWREDGQLRGGMLDDPHLMGDRFPNVGVFRLVGKLHAGRLPKGKRADIADIGPA